LKKYYWAMVSRAFLILEVARESNAPWEIGDGVGEMGRTGGLRWNAELGFSQSDQFREK